MLKEDNILRQRIIYNIYTYLCKYIHNKLTLYLYLIAIKLLFFILEVFICLINRIRINKCWCSQT